MGNHSADILRFASGAVGLGPVAGRQVVSVPTATSSLAHTAASLRVASGAVELGPVAGRQAVSMPTATSSLARGEVC
jgi:hypothetical protein